MSSARLTMRVALKEARALHLEVERAGQHWRVTYRGVFVTVHGTQKDAPRALLLLLRDAREGRDPRRRT